MKRLFLTASLLLIGLVLAFGEGKVIPENKQYPKAKIKDEYYGDRVNYIFIRNYDRVIVTSNTVITGTRIFYEVNASSGKILAKKSMFWANARKFVLQLSVFRWATK